MKYAQKLEDERAELLAALREIADMARCAPAHFSQRMHNIEHKARAALAKAEERG